MFVSRHVVLHRARRREIDGSGAGLRAVNCAAGLYRSCTQVRVSASRELLGRGLAMLEIRLSAFLLAAALVTAAIGFLARRSRPRSRPATARPGSVRHATALLALASLAWAQLPACRSER